MTPARLCLLLPLLVGGCSSTHELALPPAPDAPALDVIEREARSWPARVTTADGAQTTGRIAVVGAELTLAVAEGPARRVALTDVRRIDFRSPRRGALEGMGIGLLLGLGAGAAFGASTGDSWLREHATLVGGVLGSAVGVPLGFVVGVVRGHRTRVWVVP